MLKEENRNIGIIGVQIIDDNNEVTRTCSSFPTPFKMIYLSLGLDKLFPKVFPGHFMKEWNHNKNRIVDQVMGSYFLIRQSLFKQIGGFDERFFVYYEDLDLSLRARQAGFSSFFLATSQIYHKGGGTSEQVKANRLCYTVHSKLLYCRKHFNAKSFIIIVFVTLFIEPVVRIAYALTKGSSREVWEIVKGYAKLYKIFL